MNQTGFCAFDPRGENNAVSTIPLQCKEKPPTAADLTLEDVDLSLFPRLIMVPMIRLFSSVAMPVSIHGRHTRSMMKLIEKFPVNFVFAHFPIKEKSDYTSLVGECVSQQNPNTIWKLNPILFSTDIANLEDTQFIEKTVGDLGISIPEFQACLADPATETKVKDQVTNITKTGIFGTPTVFINGEPLVGPKPYRVYAINLAGLLYWLK